MASSTISITSFIISLLIFLTFSKSSMKSPMKSPPHHIPTFHSLLQSSSIHYNSPRPSQTTDSWFYGSPSQDQNKKKLLRYRFSSFNLAYQVREKLYKILIVFDQDGTLEFSEEEIKKALKQILQQTDTQIIYVTNNVFRYDLNKDGIITYEEFTNFCLEQHFGEMAIQRLHKAGLYHRGKERLMSYQQFTETIKYCLGFIDIKPNQSQLKTIFLEIEGNRTGYISYTEYFIFLKEYFGSRSQSAIRVKIESVQELMKKTIEKQHINDFFMDRKEEARKQQRLKTKTNEGQERKQKDKTRLQIKQNRIHESIKQNRINLIVQKPNDQLSKLQFRLSRFVYHQIKLTLLDKDIDRLLKCDAKLLNELARQIIKIDSINATIIIHKFFDTNELVSYEKILEECVSWFMSKIYPQQISSKFPLKRKEFIQLMQQGIHFITSKSIDYLLEQIFNLYCADKNQKQINQSDMQQLMNRIFINYKWPRRTGEKPCDFDPNHSFNRQSIANI